MLGRALSILAFVLAAMIFGGTHARAQDAGSSGKTILVLDASGSMWGQIDGIAKIEIAREVIGGLLATLPGEMELGLTAYGHREKGNCDDIETLVPAASGSAGAIRAAIAAISPKGMTPLSRAVQLAAEELKYEEDKATVILVSDGIETCDYDPCAIGADLERLGVDFTAHVIGFDVAEEEARAQLQCLAENTGGKFLTASSADELSAALEEVSAAEPTPEPEPELPEATVSAADEAAMGSTIPVEWTGPDAEGDYLTVAKAGDKGGDYENYVYTREGSPAPLLMPSTAGDYEIRYILKQDTRILARRPITVTEVEATVSAADEAAMGSTIEVEWTGPGADGDYLTVAKAGDKGGDYENYVYTREGSPAPLLMPSQAGDYEIRYILKQDTRILARRPITVTEVEATVNAADEAPLGSTIEVEWTGPDADGDYLTVAKAGDKGGDYENYVYTREGSPAPLLMPSTAGDYEIRYILKQDTRILARRPITVTEVEATVSAADEAAMGSTIEVEWTGPDADGDYVTVAKPGDKGGDYENYVYTREGSPAPLLMPSQAGDYEIRYILKQDTRILARRPITVTEVEATVNAADEAPLGSTIEVEWTGPDADGDYLTVAKPGDKGGDYENYVYTREGSPAPLLMPSTAGDYEIRYILKQDTRILARRPITVTEVEATVNAADEAPLGSTIDVEWTGPDAGGDYLTVAKPGDKGGDYENYVYTREGSPAPLLMPSTAGDYEIRYILKQDTRILARRPITVTGVEATLSAPGGAPAGTEVEVAWTGPDYAGDYLTVAEPGSPGSDYLTYTYTREGSPLRLQLPEASGSYEIRYILDQDARILATIPITAE